MRKAAPPKRTDDTPAGTPQVGAAGPAADRAGVRRDGGQAYWNGLELVVRDRQDLVLATPPGACTSATSPARLPISARAIGEVIEILPCLMSASSSPTIW